MKHEVKDEACYLELPSGMRGVRYEQKFVKAMPEHYPCNHAAEVVPVNAPAMKQSMGK